MAGYNGYMPDLGMLSLGVTLEEAYEDAEKLLKRYFEIATKEEFEVPSPSTLEEINEKWKDYKVSLLTANLPDDDKKA